MLELFLERFRLLLFNGKVFTLFLILCICLWHSFLWLCSVCRLSLTFGRCTVLYLAIVISHKACCFTQLCSILTLICWGRYEPGNVGQAGVSEQDDSICLRCQGTQHMPIPSQSFWERKTELVWERRWESNGTRGGRIESYPMGVLLNLADRTSDCREGIFIQPLRSCSNRAVSRMQGEKKTKTATHFVNSCCLADPWLILLRRGRILY